MRPAAELDAGGAVAQSRTGPTWRELIDRTALRHLPLIAVWIACGAYVWSYLYRGWFAHDDGALAQMAERVLAGELPHRDFDDVYTGGLDYLHALAFELFGRELTSMRLVLFGFFLAWVPALYVLARRFVSPLAAVVVVVLCVVWSVPNYTASMPSWYNLFLATFAALALFRYLDTQRGRYLFLAGLACGGSTSIKVTGMYTLVALGLALLFLEQETAPGRATGRRRSAYSIALVGAMAALAFSVLGIVHRRLGAPELVDFLVPAAVVCAFLVWNELRVPRGDARVRFARTGRLLAPLLAGALVPIALLLVPYLAGGGLEDLVAGVLLEPSARLEFASVSPPSFGSLQTVWLPAVPVAALVLLTPRRLRHVGGVAIALVLVGWLFTVDGGELGHTAWMSVRWGARLLVPLAVVALAVRMRRDERRSMSIQLFALLALAGWTALVQFPFAAPIYFAYTVPLVFLAVAALGRWRRATGGDGIPTAFALPVVALLLVFGVFGMNRDGWSSVDDPLGLPRAGSLRVDSSAATTYPRLVALVDEHSSGDSIYAGPDSPEVYFLAGKRNPTPYLFDFLEELPVREATVLRVLGDARVTVAVVNTRPDFSPPLSERLMRVVERRFPHHERVDRFDVRWST